MSPGRPGPEQLTRNLGELLQELRVVQTGVQILTGFLLTVPFSSRFEDLTALQRTTYLVVLCGSVLTTAFVVAPVAFHRVLFRRQRRYWVVEASATSALIGLGLLAVTSAGVLFLVFDVVVGLLPAVVVLAAALMCFGTLWVVVPLRASDGREPTDDS